MNQHPHTGEWPIPIQQRISDLERWIAFNAPDCDDEQKHLDEKTPERAYWHSLVSKLAQATPIWTG